MWIGPGPPVDEPRCGFHGERCLKHPDQTATIVGGVLGGLLFIVLIGAALFYRLVQNDRMAYLRVYKCELYINNTTSLTVLLHNKKL